MMDRPDAEPSRVRESLRDLAGVNRYLGGRAALLPGLRRALAGRSAAGAGWSLLDVGTGAADVPAWAAAWARSRGYDVTVVGLDRGRAAIAVARETVSGDGTVALVRGDALALPFRDRAFDVAMSSTTLHHFSGEAAVRLLRELHRVARRGVVIGDLRRSIPGYIGARLLAATVWRGHRYARHDGPLSVRRAYTVPEVRGLLRAAGLDGRVQRRAFFRLSVWIPVETER